MSSGLKKKKKKKKPVKLGKKKKKGVKMICFHRVPDKMALYYLFFPQVYHIHAQNCNWVSTH
jgi:hypothetical protein